MSDTANKLDRRNATIVIAIVVILLLWFLRKPIMNTIIQKGGEFGFSANFGGIDLGDTEWNIGDVNLGNASVYDQVSSCGCSTGVTINGVGNGTKFFMPAKVKTAAPTIVQYQTLVVAAPIKAVPKASKYYYSTSR